MLRLCVTVVAKKPVSGCEFLAPLHYGLQMVSQTILRHSRNTFPFAHSWLRFCLPSFAIIPRKSAVSHRPTLCRMKTKRVSVKSTSTPFLTFSTLTFFRACWTWLVWIGLHVMKKALGCPWACLVVTVSSLYCKGCFAPLLAWTNTYSISWLDCAGQMPAQRP